MGALRGRTGWTATFVAAAAGVLVGVAPPASAATPPLPTRMAAIGDSITRAADVCCFYGDHTGQSWSTGITAVTWAASWWGT